MTLKRKRLNSRHLGFRKLLTDLHIHTVIIERTKVLVFQNVKMIGSGRIEAFERIVVDNGDQEDIVFMGGERYFKRNCIFVYAK
ncbi:hypothetical protein M3194_15820 [Paenibacillus glycanilyticus]|uniref:hypothetical protein n=1 Tax=Paenibacillus glycanilyticus TaxID=126569 RepID=UPI00204093B3|nr:hypothetical protein [Paenibacillus glycanilyticus]MCM3628812.1 hypothetical protein [Paenibacillus glycanilyticus]